MTTSHLSECIYTPKHFDPEQNIVWGGNPCICRALRACEQRVRREDDDYAYVAAQAEADGRRHGWNEALDAARERLIYVALNYSTDPEFHALAAIDALRNPPSLPPTTGRAHKY